MNNRIDAIYTRQSVDKKDSISIGSQIECCKYELKGGNCKEYTDKWYRGKNTDFPKFQKLVRDIRWGFKMGGKALYGFHTEPIKMDGINTKKLNGKKLIRPTLAQMLRNPVYVRADFDVYEFHVDSEIEKLVDSLTAEHLPSGTYPV